MTISTTCPYCGAQSSLFFVAQDYNRRIGDKTFSYYKCPDDNLIFLHPVPEDLGTYYRSDYYQIPTSIDDLIERTKWQSDRIKLVQQFVKSGRLLEIGPSYGAFAFYAKQAGFHVDAIEMDDDCCQFLEDVVGVHAIHSNKPHETLANLEQMYDVIVMWQVIEHLAEPWQMIDSCVNHLAQGGILVIGTPNPDAFQFRIFKKRWVHADPPRHLSLIPSALLNQYSQRLNLETLKLSTKYSENPVHDSYGWKRSFMNLIASREKVGLSRVIQIFLGVIGLILNKVLFAFDKKEGNGSTYVAIFKMPENK